MLTLNKLYENNEDLKDFIAQHNIIKYENVLLQVFTGNDNIEFIKALVQTIKTILPDVKIIGTTTSGEIIDGEVTEYETVLSFTIFENTQIAVYSSRYTVGSAELAQSLITQFDQHKKPQVAISFADGLKVNGEEYLNQFSTYDSNLVVAGGLASDNGKFKKTIVFTQDEVDIDGAVVALLYNDNLIVNTNAKFGWINIGKTFTITKATDNILYEIDHMNVIDFYTKYLGEDLVSNLPASALEFPLLIKRGGINIARTVKSIGDNFYVYAGNIAVGDEVTFGYGSLETILDGEERIKKTSLDQACESIFIYSCLARKKLLGPDIGLDMGSMGVTAPLSGFFTYGEFFSNIDESQNELLNQTMTILSLSENSKSSVSKNNMNNKSYVRRNTGTVKALAHLISETSQDLEDDKKTLQIRVEEEVGKNREKEIKLLEQARFAQMGEMISMIAHQWRQPLSAISSTVNTLSLQNNNGRYDNNYFSDKLNNVLTYTQHMSTTIDDFRNFFKSNKTKQRTSIDVTIENVLNIVKVALKNKNITIITDFNCTKTVEIYANEVQQVILNLIKNAEDVFKERDVLDPEIKITTLCDNGSIIIKVEDNGGGIDNAIIDKIFDFYFSTKEDKEGTGLGLYMSKIIIQEHCAGILNVQNSSNGAVFTIEMFNKEIV